MSNFLIFSQMCIIFQEEKNLAKFKYSEKIFHIQNPFQSELFFYFFSTWENLDKMKTIKYFDLVDNLPNN